MPRLRRDVYDLTKLGPLHGTIDELRLFNVAKTESEIRENIMMAFSTKIEGLIVYLSFDNIFSSRSTMLWEKIVLEPSFQKPIVYKTSNGTRSCLKLWPILEGQGNMLYSSSWDPETLEFNQLHGYWEKDEFQRSILCLDGTTCIPSEDSLIPSTAFSISMWIKVSSSGGSIFHLCISSRWDYNWGTRSVLR